MRGFAVASIAGQFTQSALNWRIDGWWAAVRRVVISARGTSAGKRKGPSLELALAGVVAEMRRRTTQSDSS